MDREISSFISPSTKELQRKQLGKLTFFACVISQEKREKQWKKYREMFSYQFVARKPKI